LELDAELIEVYRKRQPTISEHQQTIAGYLRLRPFDDAEVTKLEQFLFEEACRLEQTAALTGRAREFLKEQRVLEPAEFRIARIVGEQRVRAREHIFRRVAALVPSGLASTLEDLLVVNPDENSSGLQAIKANPSKPSVDAMLTLLDKLRVIEATGVLGLDLSWLNGNYQRALFHQVRKSSVTRYARRNWRRRRSSSGNRSVAFGMNWMPIRRTKWIRTTSTADAISITGTKEAGTIEAYPSPCPFSVQAMGTRRTDSQIAFRPARPGPRLQLNWVGWGCR